MTFKITYLPADETDTAVSECDCFFVLYALALRYVPEPSFSSLTRSFWNLLYDFPANCSVTFGNFCVESFSEFSI